MKHHDKVKVDEKEKTVIFTARGLKSRAVIVDMAQFLFVPVFKIDLGADVATRSSVNSLSLTIIMTS